MADKARKVDTNRFPQMLKNLPLHHCVLRHAEGYVVCKVEYNPPNVTVQEGVWNVRLIAMTNPMLDANRAVRAFYDEFPQYVPEAQVVSGRQRPIDAWKRSNRSLIKNP